MGFLSPISMQARTTRLSLFSISASPRCTALKSKEESLEPCTSTELAAPPPTPIRYTGPPILASKLPLSKIIIMINLKRNIKYLLNSYLSWDQFFVS